MSIYRKQPARTRGMTLVELMLGLMVTAIIGLAMVTVFSSIANSTKKGSDALQLRTQKIIIGERVGLMVRSSRQILDVSSTHIVLWMSDANDSDTPNISEMVRIEWDSDTTNLSVSIAPSSLAEVDDTEYALDSDFDSVTQSLAGSSSFPTTNWSTNVSSLAFIIDNGDLEDVRIVQMKLSLSNTAGDAESIAMVMGLRG